MKWLQARVLQACYAYVIADFGRRGYTPDQSMAFIEAFRQSKGKWRLCIKMMLGGRP